MNKKFLTISLVILIVIGAFFSIFKLAFGEKIFLNSAYDEYGDYSYDRSITFEYLGYEKVNGNTEIRIAAKNNHEYIATISDLTLSFVEKPQEGDSGNYISMNDGFCIKGEAKSWYDYLSDSIKNDNAEYERNYGVEPGEEVEYIFIIPDGISFDENKFDLNVMRISVNVDYFKYRLGERTLLFRIGSYGASDRIENNLEPIVID